MPFAARGGFLSIPIGNAYGNNAYFEGVADHKLSINNPPEEFVTWRANYTIEYWFYYLNTTNSETVANPGPGNHNSFSTNYWSFGPVANGKVQFYYWSPGQTFVTSNANVLTENNWHYLAASCTDLGDGNVTIETYCDGSRVATSTTTTGIFGNTSGFNMGQFGARYLYGYMDHLRISNVTRYTGTTMTVPSQPFSVDGSTMAYITMDGANGSTTFSDSANNYTIINSNNNVYVSDARTNHS